MPSSHPLPVLPPRYRLWPDPARALLGTGGASAVWRVQDEALGVLVALKVLKSSDRLFHARLEREAVLSSRVVHPNVIALHDVGRTPDGMSYLALALASDGSMLEMASRPPPWRELRRLMIELLQALGALHARGILHLDVKLSNLLLHRLASGQRQLWLADLGVARALWGEDDDDKSVVGTVSYMAPERLTGQHHLWCPSTDLFAVGAMFFRLLTGALPYPARSPAEGMTQRMSPPTAVVLRPGLWAPRAVRDVILPMLAPDPRGRFDLASDVIRALEALPDAPAATRPPGFVPPVPGPGEVSEPHADNPAGVPAVAPAPGVPAWNRPPVRIPPEALPRPARVGRVPQAPSLLVHREIRLVGRERELGQLWSAAQTVMRTRRPLLLEVRGPLGVGRTRLLDEFLRSLEEGGLGEGIPMQYAVASGPAMGLRGAWRRIAPPGSARETYVHEIQALLARDQGATLAQCAQDAAALATWLDPELDEAPTFNRSAVRGMLVEHLERRAWRGVSWLRVEDAHLAGENDDVWSIIDQLMARAAPVLILVSTREGSSPAALMELRALHHRRVRTLELAPLASETSEALVDAFLPLDDALRAQVAEHGQGVPRWTHQLLAWWVSSGRLVEGREPDRGRRWSLEGGPEQLPEDQHAFARARLADIAADPVALQALKVLAVSGPGTPERVVRRLAGESLDRLVLDRFVALERGLPVLSPPELSDVVFEALEGDEGQMVLLHAALAEAWSHEGDAPAVRLRVGVHRQAAGDDAQALAPLDQALRGLHQRLPVEEVRTLAHRILQASEAVGLKCNRVWVHAALVLADAHWRVGDAEAADALDAAIASVPLAPDHALQAACGRILRRGPGRTASLRDLEALRALLDAVSTHDRAAFHTTVATVLTWRLDVEGALAALHDALANRPRPATACRARLLRARLLSVIDPVVGWHEALRTIELARDHGLLRYEVLAWGLAAGWMVRLGRGQEAIERLRTGIARLDAHGERSVAQEARLHLGAALRAAGRSADARSVLEAAPDATPHHATTPLDARAALGMLAAVERRPALLRRLLPDVPRAAGDAVAWALLQTLARLLDPSQTATRPHREAVDRALAIGEDGLFVVRAIAELLVQRDEVELAAELRQSLQTSCGRLGVEADASDALLERFRRARGEAT